MSIWSAARADAALFDSGQDPLAAPLWHGTTPDWFRDADLGMRAIWDAAPGTWVFWRRWWDGILSGNQIDRDLQEAVALIPNEIWRAGPDEVAQEIARIEERNDLRKRVSELGRLVLDAIAIPAPPAPAGLRSHNNPPEMVDPVAELRGELDRLRTGIVAASHELAKPRPDRGVLAAIGRRLAAAARYSLGKLDRALDSAADEAGKAVVKLTLWTLILERVKDFGEHLIRTILW